MMNTEEKYPSLTAFLLSWTLSKSNPPTATVTAQALIPLETYPREWSLSTVPESVSDATETQNDVTAHHIVEDDFPIALSNLNETAIKISSPSTFERNWTLPRIEQPIPPHGNNRSLFGSTWSPGAPHHDITDPAGFESASLDGFTGIVPRHVVPHTSSGSNQRQFTQSPETSAPFIPGNFRPRGYSNTYASRPSSQGLVSSASSSLPENRLVHRLAGHYNNVPSNSAVSSGTAASSSYGRGTVTGQVQFAPESAMKSSNTSPETWDGPSYKLPRPAGFVAQHISPQSVLENDHRMPQPTGFGPDNVTPPIWMNSQNHDIRSPAQPQHAETTTSSRPRSPLQRDPGMPFAPIEIPVQMATLPTNANWWLYAEADDVYKPPAAPMTERAPWSSEFVDDGVRWRNLG